MNNSPYPPHMPPPVVVVNQQTGSGCLIRAVWFVFVGLWLGAILTAVGWALCVSVIGLPLGLMIFNRLPQAMTLQPSKLHTNVVVGPNGQLIIQQSRSPQHSMLIRSAYFVLIGWWFSGIWLFCAWMLAGVSFGLLLPIAFAMFNVVPQITTLQRN